MASPYEWIPDFAGMKKHNNVYLIIVAGVDPNGEER